MTSEVCDARGKTYQIDTIAWDSKPLAFRREMAGSLARMQCRDATCVKQGSERR